MNGTSHRSRSENERDQSLVPLADERDQSPVLNGTSHWSLYREQTMNRPKRLTDHSSAPSQGSLFGSAKNERRKSKVNVDAESIWDLYCELCDPSSKSYQPNRDVIVNAIRRIGAEECRLAVIGYSSDDWWQGRSTGYRSDPPVISIRTALASKHTPAFVEAGAVAAAPEATAGGSVMDRVLKAAHAIDVAIAQGQIDASRLPLPPFLPDGLRDATSGPCSLQARLAREALAVPWAAVCRALRGHTGPVPIEVQQWMHDPLSDYKKSIEALTEESQDEVHTES